MESNNAPVSAAGDKVLDRALRFSRFLRRLLDFESDLADRAEFDRPWDATRLRARLD